MGGTALVAPGRRHDGGGPLTYGPAGACTVRFLPVRLAS